MRRREFLVLCAAFGAVAPAAMGAAAPRLAGACEVWLVSSDPRADAAAASLRAAGHRVRRVDDDPQHLWRQFAAPVLADGNAVRGLAPGGTPALLAQLAHLKGRLATPHQGLAVWSERAFEPWELQPWHWPVAMEKTT